MSGQAQVGSQQLRCAVRSELWMGLRLLAVGGKLHGGG